jgi:hypothetical protein
VDIGEKERDRLKKRLRRTKWSAINPSSHDLMRMTMIRRKT